MFPREFRLEHVRVKLAVAASGLLLTACDFPKSDSPRENVLKNEVLASRTRVAPKLRANDASVCAEPAVLSEVRNGLFEGLGGDVARKDSYFNVGGLELSVVRVEKINPIEHRVTCTAATVLGGRTAKIDFDIFVATERPQIMFAIDANDRDLTTDLKVRLSKVGT